MNNRSIMANKEIDPIDTHVGKRLTLVRNLRGISQGELGKAVDVSFQQIQKYESGANRISASRLVRIATCMQVSVAWFFEQTPEDLSPAPHIHHHNELLCGKEDVFDLRETQKLIAAYYSIKDTKKRKAVLCIVLSMAGATES